MVMKNKLDSNNEQNIVEQSAQQNAQQNAQQTAQQNREYQKWVNNNIIPHERGRKRLIVIAIIIINILIILSFVTLLSTSCSSGVKKKMEAVEAMKNAVQTVTVASPVVNDITLTKEYPGVLEAENSVELVARVQGYINKVNYNPGDYVKKGALLFVIEPTLYKNSVNQAEGDLESAQAELEYAKSSYERTLQAARSNAVSEITVIQTKANLNKAKAAVVSAEAALSTAKTNLGYCYIKAPSNGNISVNIYDIGAYVNGAAEPVVLANLYDNNSVYVNFAIAESMLPQIKNLDSLTICLTDEGAKNSMQNSAQRVSKEVYAGKIDYVSPNVDVTTGTLNVRAILRNKGGVLRDGMYVQVSLPYMNVSDAVLVKNISIGSNQAGNYMYVLGEKDSKGDYTVEQKSVVVGEVINDSLRVIERGVRGGDRYITKALMKVRDGGKVEIK